MAFDIQAARKAGYTDDEIADFLGNQSKFDVAGARKAGYTAPEIVGFLSQAANDAKPDQGLTPLDTEQVTSARPWQGAGAGRGSPNDPRRVDVEQPTKAPGGVGAELGQLRDEAFMGVQQSGAAVSNINAFAQANRLANTEQLIRDLETRGRGDSAAASRLRAEADSLRERLPATVGTAAEANADTQRASQMTMRPAIKKVSEAKTFGDAWEAFKEAPYDVIAGVTAQSLPQVLPGLIATAVTGPAAGAAAMGLNSGVVEFGSSLTDFAQDKGVDTRSAKAVQNFYADPANLSDALKYAGTRAVIIGTMDAASGGIAGKTLAPAMRSPIKRQAVNMPAQMAVQGAAGGGGEAAAQLATKGEIDQPGQVFLEVAGELGGAPAEVAAFTREAAGSPQGQAARALAADLESGQLPAAQVETLNPNLAIQRKTQEGLINIGAAQTVDDAIAAATQATAPQNKAVDNIARLLGETPDVSQPGNIPAVDSGSSGLGAPEPAIGVDTGVGVSGAAERTLDAGSAGNQPDGGTVPLGDGGTTPALSPDIADTTSRIRELEGVPTTAARANPAIADPKSAIAQPSDEPASMWFGRRGDGYQTPEDASAALPSRQRVSPDLDWKVEQMPSGRYRLAGYDTQTQQPASFKVTLNPTGTATIIGNPDAIKAKLAEAGIDKVMSGADRVIVGTSQAQAAVQVLQTNQPPALANTAQPAINSVANDQNQPTRENGQAQAPAVEAPKGGVYTLTDAISADGPVSETVRLIVRPDGSSAIQRENGDVIDVTNMIRAGFSAERAIAQSLGDDTSGKNVSRNEQNPPKKPEPKAKAPAVEAPAPAGSDATGTAVPAPAGPAKVEGGGVEQPEPASGNQPSLEDLNSGKAFVDSTKAKIAKWVASGTNNGTRAMDRRWEREAVKRFIDDTIKPMLAGKQTGNRAAAKIAIGKAQTFDELAAAVEKFGPPVTTNPPTQAQAGTLAEGAGESRPAPVAAPEPTAEQKIRQVFDAAPRTIGSWHKLTVEHNGKTQEFLANMKRVNTSGKRDSAIHLVNIRPGRLMAGDPLQDLAYYYKLDGKNNLVEEGIPSIATPEQLKAFGRPDPRLIPVSQRNVPKKEAKQNTSPEPAQKTAESEQVAAAQIGNAKDLPDNSGVVPGNSGPYGRDLTPIAQGGKPFKSLEEAREYRKKNTNNMVVKKVGKNQYVLQEASAKQIAAWDKAGKRLGIPQTGGEGPQHVHGFLIGKGGLNKKLMADAGFDRNHRIGNHTLFAGTGGMTAERATELLTEAGYLKAGASHSDMFALVRKSVQTPQYTSDGWEQLAQAEQSTRFEDHLAVEQESDEDPFGPLSDFTMQDAEMAGLNGSSMTDAMREEVAALLAMVEAKGVDGESILEDAARVTDNDQDYYDRAKQALQEAIAQSGGSRGIEQDGGPAAEGRGQEAQPAGRADRREDAGEQGDAGGLTAPTPAQVLEQQDRADRAEELDQREQIQREAEGFQLQAQAPEQRSDNTGDMFGGPSAEDVMRARKPGKRQEDDGTEPMFRRGGIDDETRAQNLKKWSNNAPYVSSAQADTYDFKTGQKVMVEAYHGTARPDRVGTVFQRKRATSGPMAFFTSAPELASSYAKGKADTSITDEERNYPQWFKYTPAGQRSAVDIVRAWNFLPNDTKDRIAALAPRIKTDDATGEQIEIGPEGTTNGVGNYEWEIQQTQRSYDRRGNPLKALVEGWLNGGMLFNEEERFLRVLELAGFPVKDVNYDAPNAAYPFVYKTYIAMQKPLVTGDVPQPVIDALQEAAKRDRSRAQAGGADMWDKNTRTLREWVANFTDPDNTSASYVWTSIPDKVTAVLKSMGYDGIIDWSGKGGGDRHPVYIPFEETQVKSALGNKGTFDSLKKNILLSRGTPAWRSELRDQTGGMPTSEAQAHVTSLTKKWKNGPPITVVATPADLPMEAPGDARGVYWKGQVWVVAGPHKDRADLSKTLAHEAIAHFGLKNILTDAEWRRYMANIQVAIKAGNKSLTAIRDEIRERYVDSSGKPYLTAQQEADEIAAAVVEQAVGPDGEFRPGFGFVKSVYARIMQFLRELGLDVNLTLAEVQGMLVLAQKNLEAGKRTVGQGDVVVAAGRGDQRPMDMRAYHGTPHKVDKFSTDKIGTGEGAQAYGWGLYFTDTKEIAAHYRHLLVQRDPQRLTLDGERVDPNSMLGRAIEDMTKIGKAAVLQKLDDNIAFNEKYAPAMAESYRQARATVESLSEDRIAVKNGNLYEVEIPEAGEMLLWDKPLSDQPAKVRKQLDDVSNDLYWDAVAKWSGLSRSQLDALPAKDKDAAMDKFESIATSGSRFAGSPKYPPQTRNGMTGQEYYQELTAYFGDQATASETLLNTGIKGIKYLDGMSRNKPLRDVKREFLAELPEDAEFSDVMDLLGTGTFSPKNEAVIKALASDDWLGFDYPAQALSAALSGRLQDFDASPALVRAVAETQDGSTYNYVVFSGDDVAIQNAMFSRSKDQTNTPEFKAWFKGSKVVAAGRGDQALSRTGKDQTNTPEFAAWFKGSKVVDAEGKPLRVYHGTNADFSVFNTTGGSDKFANNKLGAFFAADPDMAQYGRVQMPVYLSIKNPYVAKLSEWAHWQNTASAAEVEAKRAQLIDGGHDGVTDGMGVYVAFHPEQIKSATGNRGTFDPADPNIMFSRGTTAAPGREGWDMPTETRLDKTIYELQDGGIDLKRVQEAIKKTGADLDERFDARLAETLYPGRVAKRSENFLKTEVRPLLQAMALLKVDMTELGDYLIARHAPERNAQIAKINPDLPDGGAGRNSEGTLMTDDAAAEYLEAIPADKLRALETLAAKVDAITAGTRNLWVSEGLETPETVRAMEQAYKHYVPLFKDEAEFSHPQGMGFSVRGGASKRAMGSTKEVTNVLAHVLMAREAAITRAEKNRVGMALYGLALSYPNPDFWTVIRPNMSNTAIAAELNAMGVDPEMMGEGMSSAPTIRVIDPVTNTVVNRPNPAYKNMDNAVMLKVGGEDRVIVFNQRNERAMRMAVNLKNLDGLTKLELANSILGKATRYIAAVNTQYNPVFGLVNIIRDVQGATLNLTTTAIKDKKRQVLRDIPAALSGIARDLRGDANRSEWSDLWEQYQEDGGQTGYREMFRAADDRAKAIEKELGAMDRSTPGKAAHAVLDLMDDFNTALENAVRLSAYKAALDTGLSRKEAARLGKELTVNFNRKGRAGRELSPMYAFMNAAIQGNARLFETLRGPAAGKIVAGGLMLGAAQALMLAAAGFDDDEIPEWVKARALIIPVDFSSKRYITIPIALGFNVIPNTGRVLTEIGLNGGKDAKAKAVSAIGEILGSLSPVGGGNIFTADGALKLIAPTVADPVIEIVANRNFAGAPIEREAMENDGRPGYQRARESTLRSASGQAYTGISRALNAMTMGTTWEAGAVSPSPEMIRYVARVFGGGLLGEIERVIDAGANIATGTETKSTRVPLTSRFYGEVDPAQVEQRRFFDAARKIQRIERSVKAAKKAGDDDEASRIEADNEIYQFAGQLDRVQSRLRKLNKQATETINNPAEIRDIDAARTDEMKALNDEVRAMEAERYGQTAGSRLRKVAAQP